MSSQPNTIVSESVSSNNQSPQTQATRYSVRWDWIFNAIVIGLFIASVLFYFQVVQPSVLSNLVGKYIAKNTGDISIMRNTISDNSNRLNATITAIISDYNNVSNDECSVLAVRTPEALTALEQTFTNVELNLKVDKRLTSQNNYYFYTDAYSQDQMKQLVDQYSSLLTNYQTNVSTLRQLPKITTYVNIWRENCEQMVTYGAEQIDFTSLCTKLTSAYTDIRTDMASRYPQLKSANYQQTQFCVSDPKLAYAKKVTLFMDGYDSLKTMALETSNYSQDIQIKSQDFLSELNAIGQDLTDYYTHKTQFRNSFYFLNTRF